MNETTMPTRLEEALSRYFEATEEGREVDRDALLEEFGDVAVGLREFFEGEAVLLDYAGPTAVEAGLETAVLDTSRIGAVGSTSIAPTIAHADSADRIAAIPETFGRYTIEACLGSGAMGAVFRAHDPKLDRRVALKVPKMRLEAGSDAWDRFEREAQAAARLRHPNICAVHDVGEHEGLHYIAMAYVDGETLEDRLKSNGPLPIDEAVSIVRKLADALGSAHAQGVVHRDLKPANVMLDADGEPVITDFGLAVQFERPETRITQHGTLVGTPAYMAPEQIEGDPENHGPAVDVYALGIILYECLTGRVPFRGTITAVVSQALGRLPDPPSAVRSEVPPHLDDVCLRMLAKSAGDRFPTMGEVAGALDTEQRPVALSPRRRWPVAGAVTSLAVLGVFLFSGTPPAEDADSNQSAGNGTEPDGTQSEVTGSSIVERPTLIRRFEGDHKRVWSVAISPDGKLAASGSGYETAWQEGMTDGIVIWNFETGEVVRRLSLERSNVRGLQFSPSGRLLLAACRSTSQLQFWDVESGRLVKVLRDGALGAAFFNERFVVSHSMQGVNVWNLEVDQVVASYPQTEGIASIAVHPPTRMLAIGLGSGLVRILDLADGREMHRFSTPPLKNGQPSDMKPVPRAIAFSPDGSRLVAGFFMRGARCWEVGSGKQIFESRFYGESIAWMLNGEHFFMGIDGRWGLFSASNPQPVAAAQVALRVRDVAIAPDGRSLLFGGGPRYFHREDDRDFALQHWRLPEQYVPDSLPKPAKAEVPVAWLHGSERVDAPIPSVIVAETLTGIVVDDDEAELVGSWTTSRFNAGFTGKGYRHDNKAGKGEKSATYRMPVETAGTYQLLVSYTAGKGRETKVPVTIHAADGPATVKVNQEAHPQLRTGFQPLGEFSLEAGVVDVVIETKDTTGHVIIDAVRLLTPEQFAVALEKEKGQSDEERAWAKLVKADKLLGHFTREIEKNPKRAEGHGARGDYLRTLAARRGNDVGLLRRALEDFNVAVRLQPKNFYWWFQKAFLHEGFAERDACDLAYRRCAELLRNKQNRNEKEERHLAWSYLNNCSNLVRKGDIDGAMKMGDEAVAVAPGIPRAQMNRGIAYLRHRDYATALESLDRAIAAAGGFYPEALLNKADVLDVFGDIPTAQASAGHAYSQTRGPRAAVAVAAYSTALGQYDTARFVLTTTRENAPDDVGTAYQLGRTCASAGDFDDALAAYAEALKLVDEPLIRVERAKLLRHLRQPTLADDDELRALAAFTKVIDEDATNTNALERRARLHWSRGNLDEALADWESVIERDPRHVFGLSHVALLLSAHPNPDRRDGKRALRLAKRLGDLVFLEGRRKRAFFVSVLAAAHAENGNWPEALTLQRQALAGCPLTEYGDYAERLESYVEKEPFRLDAEPEDHAKTFADIVVPESIDAASFDALKPFAAKPLPPPQIAKQRAAIVLVKSEQGFGTGMIVDQRGCVLTCAHVLPYSGAFTIHYESGGRDLEATGVPIAVDHRNDLALVRFDPPKGAVLQTVHLGLKEGLEDAAPTKFLAGSTAVVIGNPGNGNWVLEKVVLTGTIASERQMIGEFTKRPFVQVSANVAPGCSGGPLFDDTGRVVGVVAQKAHGLDDTGFAVPMDRVATFLGLKPAGPPQAGP